MCQDQNSKDERCFSGARVSKIQDAGSRRGRGKGGGTEGEGSGWGRGGASHRKSSVSGIKSFNGSFSLTLGKYQKGNIMQVVEQGGLDRIRSEEELTIVTSA